MTQQSNGAPPTPRTILTVEGRSDRAQAGRDWLNNRQVSTVKINGSPVRVNEDGIKVTPTAFGLTPVTITLLADEVNFITPVQNA